MKPTFSDFKENTTHFFQRIFHGGLNSGFFCYTVDLKRYTFKKKPTVTLGERFWHTTQLWYTPLLFKSRTSRTRANGLGSYTLWVDKDVQGAATLPPSLTVKTKNGSHLYYIVDEFITDLDRLERTNRALANLEGESECWDAPRLLRVPYTYHLKDPNDPQLITYEDHEHTYKLSEIDALLGLPIECLSYIGEGQAMLGSDGRPDRSISDYILLSEMLKDGVSEKTALFVWLNSQANSKALERGDKYIENVLRRAKKNAANTIPERGQGRNSHREARTTTQTTPTTPNATPTPDTRRFVTLPTGTYMLNDNQEIHICNFIATILGGILIEGPLGEQELSYNISFQKKNFEVTCILPKSAFNSRKLFMQVLQSYSLVWFESDKVLAYYFDHLTSQAFPMCQGRTSIGLHFKDNDLTKPYYLLENGLLDSQGAWHTRESSHTLTFMDQTVLKGYDYRYYTDHSIPANLPKLLTQINKPEISWSFIGWFTSSLIRPYFYQEDFRFPHLAFLGPAGAGKTTTINSFMRSFGNVQPQSVVAETTTFSVLRNMSATTCFPLSLSEVSNSPQVRKLRSLLLTLYDGSRATRGRRDQSLAHYPLQTPTILDGNYLPLTDRAFVERCILLWSPPASKRTNSHTTAMEKVRAILHSHRFQSLGMFEAALEWMVKHLSTRAFDIQLNEIFGEMLQIYKGVSERVVRNYTVIYFGITQYCKMFQLTPPPITIFGSLIYQTEDIGRVDALTFFMEFVINSLQISSSNISIIRGEEFEVGFRMNEMYRRYEHFTRVLPPNTTRDGLRLALVNAPYFVKHHRVQDLSYYMIDLKIANKYLNTPIHAPEKQGRVNL